MREIIFRGKRLSDGKWVEGNLFRPDLETSETQICVGTPVVRICYAVNPETIGQFTGLTTADGTRIFEGDIIGRKRFDGSECIEGVIEYGTFNCSCCDGVYGWYVSNSGDIRELGEPCSPRLRVAGNIHDNPELLERR